ncbi:hypothetical protein [Nonomuraea sp. NPDC049158]|uniref:hypothetical protein n=1 Tax=Nonomuraea sp. NPDC049158 TaxID=3155649 RepID=UPI0033CE377E
MPTDPALCHPPGRPEAVTIAGRVHGLLEHAAVLVGFAWIIAAGLRLRSPDTVGQA